MEEDVSGKQWNFDIAKMPKKEFVWLAMEEWWGDKKDQCVILGFKGTDGLVSNDGEYIHGDIIAWMEYKEPEFPETEALTQQAHE